MKHSFFIFIFILAPALSAQAEIKPSWQLMNGKGPSEAWKCSPEIQVTFLGSSLSIKGENTDLTFENINGGRTCHALNSSYIFGGVSCREATLVETNPGQILIEKKQCTRESFLYQSCDPRKELASHAVSIEEDRSLTIFQRTGWYNSKHQDFVCNYK